jgi:RNA polymerase sigma factor (sigma-70 family)
MTNEQEQVKLRLARLMEHPFRVFSEDAFDDPKKEAAILSPMPDLEDFNEKRRKIYKGDEDVLEFKILYQEPILSREQEGHLFRQFNFMKHKALRLLKRINVKRPNKAEVEDVEDYLRKANDIKRQIVISNARLVVNMVKKTKEYYQNKSKDLMLEMCSDGNVALIHSVDLFDYRKGNKFCTYATWAIINELSRNKTYRTKHSVCMSISDETLENLFERSEGEKSFKISEKMQKLLLTIPKREREIILECFGLDGKGCRKLGEVGERIGVSKERVRQLREQGLSKLREVIKRDLISVESLEN